MQKGAVLPFLLIALVLVGAILGYLYLKKDIKTVLQTPIEKSANETTLQTYTNNNLGFELQFPQDLKVVEDSEENFNKRGNGDFRKNFNYYITYPPAKVLGIVAVLDESNSFDQNPFTIWVFNNDNNLTIEQWYEKFWYYPFVWGDYTYTGKTTLAPHDEATVSGQMAKSGVIDYQPGKPKFVYLSKNKKMYLFRIIEETGDHILSTFKFLQPTNRVAPSEASTVCAQIITPAKNSKTGECKDFPTPCDVPEGWEKVTNCPNADILFDHECKVGKDGIFPDQCPNGYKCAFTGEYPDEINGIGNCVKE